ncbi:unnamed protein product, partial [Prorocentrum cordatum]
LGPRPPPAARPPSAALTLRVDPRGTRRCRHEARRRGEETASGRRRAGQRSGTAGAARPPGQRLGLFGREGPCAGGRLRGGRGSVGAGCLALDAHHYAAELPVPRLNISSPGALATFFERYHNRGPLVIEGALQEWPALRWTAESLSERCPSARLPVFAYDLGSADWAALRDAGEMPLGEYLATQFGRDGDGGRRGDALYGLEMSLRNECPALLEDLRIPALFADDMLATYYKKGAWPTLIIGPGGSQSGLHRDTHDLPFWMAMFRGRKRWRIFLPDDEGLQPLYNEAKNGFSFDPFAPDFWKYPGLGKVSVYDHVLLPGELLYIPSGAPHAAYNLEDTIAISGNYLDGRGLQRHTEGTCQQPLWRDSKLCWFYDQEFRRHRPLPLEEVRELTFFQFYGFSGPSDWCKAFSTELHDRAEKRPELRRNFPILDAYCPAEERRGGSSAVP